MLGCSRLLPHTPFPSAKMSSLKVMSWNVRGLNSKFKRALMLDVIKRQAPHIVCIQETHLTGQKVLSLKRAWVARGYHSSYSVYARGVSILISKALPIEVIQVAPDHFGRYVVIHCALWGFTFTIVSVYVPPPFDPAVLHLISSKLASMPPSPILCIGDFNAVPNPSLDRTSGLDTGSVRLNEWLTSLDLADVWRSKHPQEREYSFYSSVHKSFSRIDLAFVSPDMMQHVDQVSYCPRSASDHSALLISLLIGPPSDSRLWRLHPAWLLSPAVQSTVRAAHSEFWDVHSTHPDPLLVWDSYKSSVRGAFMSGVAGHRKLLNAQEERLTAALVTAEKEYLEKPTPGNKKTWAQAQRNHLAVVKERTSKRLQAREASIFEFGDKNGKLLAYLSRAERPCASVPSILDSSGALNTEPRAINMVFHEFYSSLYSSRLSASSVEISRFLGSLPLWRLTPAQSLELDAPLSAEEVELAIQSLPPGKTPGLDGLGG
ncbi:receptor expression-enhancing protein 1 isoform X1 [Engystomops pustulosus]|uniref:receptor expression-enhancing protein 1 isoform X1 n=1 Tax=Engystomops pustulosus TaxID=76066 RepID=UPI003AFA333B